MIREDLVIKENIKIGALTILYKSPDDNSVKWICRCDCGNIVQRNESSLKNAIRKSRFSTCGCMVRELNDTKRSIVGMDFTFFTVKHFNIETNIYICNNNNDDFILTPKQLCRRLANLENRLEVLNRRKNLAKACGCNNYEEYVKQSIRLHHLLVLMKNRCYDANNQYYKYYGKKGITICDEWKDNPNKFVEWALTNGYNESLQIDRIDNNKGYCPENCKWSSRIEQANNKSNNSYISYNNEIKTLSTWCRDLGLNYKKTHARLKYLGWSIEKAFNINAMEDRA